MQWIFKEITHCRVRLSRSSFYSTPGICYKHNSAQNTAISCLLASSGGPDWDTSNHGSVNSECRTDMQRLGFIDLVSGDFVGTSGAMGLSINLRSFIRLH